jgi:hypothetical protein
MRFSKEAVTCLTLDSRRRAINNDLGILDRTSSIENEREPANVLRQRTHKTGESYIIILLSARVITSFRNYYITRVREVQ